jgi:protoheme IX farnesyltransferase
MDRALAPAFAPGPDAQASAPETRLPTGIRRVVIYVRDLLILTKYRITLLALFTGYTALVVQGDAAHDPGRVAPCLLALFLTGGAANTLNQLFELKKDAVMSRTKARRPLPAGRISPRAALVFALVQIALAQAILLGLFRSPLAAALAALTIVYYSFFYTLWLKPRHWLNIVVGGVPGAMGPLIAWAAVTNEVAAAPLAMSALIFLWTPPHVWALAIRLKDDYARAGIPMLPVVKGIDETTRQIFIYTLVLVAGTLALPLVLAGFAHSPAYLLLALVLGAVFIAWTAVLWRRRPLLPTMPLFRFSIVYIGALFLGLVVDAWRMR